MKEPSRAARSSTRCLAKRRREMRNLFQMLWAKFKAPIVFVCAALAALVAVAWEAFVRGERRSEAKEVKAHEKDDLKRVDEMAARGDSDGLRDDILKRSGG
jgi:hypothetical protein